jgi:hypothetical protein
MHRHTGLQSHGGEHRDALGHRGRQRHRAGLRERHAGGSACKIQSLVHHRQQVFSRGHNLFQAIALPPRQRVGVIAGHQGREAEHRVQRRSKLMAQAGEGREVQRAGTGFEFHGDLLSNWLVGILIQVPTLDKGTTGQTLGNLGQPGPWSVSPPCVIGTGAKECALDAPRAPTGARSDPNPKHDGLAQHGYAQCASLASADRIKGVCRCTRPINGVAHLDAVRGLSWPVP